MIAQATPDVAHYIVVTREWGEANQWEYHEYRYRRDTIKESRVAEGAHYIWFLDGSMVMHPLHTIQNAFSEPLQRHTATNIAI